MQLPQVARIRFYARPATSDPGIGLDGAATSDEYPPELKGPNKGGALACLAELEDLVQAGLCPVASQGHPGV